MLVISFPVLITNRKSNAICHLLYDVFRMVYLFTHTMRYIMIRASDAVAKGTLWLFILIRFLWAIGLTHGCNARVVHVNQHMVNE